MEQIPAETQARWQAAMMGPGYEYDDGLITVDHPKFSDIEPFNIYDSDTALIDAVELASLSIGKAPNQANGGWYCMNLLDLCTTDFPSWRATATAAVEAVIREWEQNDG